MKKRNNQGKFLVSAFLESLVTFVENPQKLAIREVTLHDEHYLL
jgi:hypothetical protein